VLTADGLDLTGWDLTEASGISDGQTIVGFWYDPNNMIEAWIAVIPEPGTGLPCHDGPGQSGAAGKESERTRKAEPALTARRLGYQFVAASLQPTNVGRCFTPRGQELTTPLKGPRRAARPNPTRLGVGPTAMRALLPAQDVSRVAF
jgi:hypothetical protein